VRGYSKLFVVPLTPLAALADLSPQAAASGER
jgi:hypothetical protein